MSLPNIVFVLCDDLGINDLHCYGREDHKTPYRAGKGYTYEGGQRVPTIVRWSGHISGGKVIDSPVNNIDWIPTLLELAGLPSPSGIDGVSFAGGLLGGKFPERKICWHFPHYTNQGGRPSGAIRDGKWLLVEFYDEEKTELYDLSSDVGQGRDVAGEYSDKVVSLDGELDKWRRENNVQYNKPNPQCNEEEFRQLYVDIDPSRFDPISADDSQWRSFHEWRRGMDEAGKLKALEISVH